MSLELPEPIVLLLGELDELELLLPDVEGLAPIVPLLLLGELDELELEDGVLVEPEEPVVDEPELDGEAVEGVLEEEPLAPMEVPLLLGVLADEPLEPVLALGLLDELLELGVLDELLELGVLLLEPEAPMVPVDGEVPDGEAPPAAAPEPEVSPALLAGPAALPLLPLLPELWAIA